MRILLLDAGWSQTAFLITELARAGAQCVVASPPVPDLKLLSRYCRHIPSPALDDTGYADFVRALVRTEPADMILPLCEPVQQLLWALPEIEQARVFPRAVTPVQRELLADRRALYSFASELNIPIPRDEAIADEADLGRVLNELGLPCVLRGTQGMSGEQVKIVRDAVEAACAYRSLRSQSPQPPFAQEYLDGRRCLIGGLFERGRALQWFSQRTIECCPAPTGPSVRVQSLQDPILRSYAERLFLAFGWDGLACAEFIQLAPGVYRFLEINPRPWAAIKAADRCGVRLVRLFAHYLLGRKPHAGREYADGLTCTLFPAFFAARIRSGQFPRWRDVPAYWQALRAAPWSRPMLLLHFVRMLYWARNAARVKKVAAVTTATPGVDQERAR